MLFVCEIEKDSDRLVNSEHHFGATGNRRLMKLYIYNKYIIYYIHNDNQQN